jgi:hypothetical protein
MVDAAAKKMPGRRAMVLDPQDGTMVGFATETLDSTWLGGREGGANTREYENG